MTQLLLTKWRCAICGEMWIVISDEQGEKLAFEYLIVRAEYVNHKVTHALEKVAHGQS